MSDRDLERLRLLAEAALEWSDEWFAGAHPIQVNTPALTMFIGECSPARILELVAELER